MKRTLLWITIILLALVVARGVAALPQSKGLATLTGTVLGPDDRPVAHASVSYQSSSGNAPHAVHTDSRVTVFNCLVEQLLVLALSSAHHRRENLELRPFRKG